MRKEYDFSKSKKNPYANALKKQITIRIDQPTVDYFRQLSSQMGMPYQSLINLYLRDCAEHNRKLKINWTSK
ncbi:MAG: antitoxin [Elusimicrobia bacterium]|nr:MAG: antitoxin [Elusimicrobiota bacterium]